MMREQEASRLAPVGAVAMASRLQRELAQHGITADVNDGYGLAVVSVWCGLLVWTDGHFFWWRVGWNGRRDRAVYAYVPASDPRRAARRVAVQYQDLHAAARAALRGGAR